MRSILLTVLLTVMVGASAVAQVPRTISFQGRARDAAGKYPDNVKQMTIRIYDALSGGQQIFIENHQVLFQRGAFTVIIGDKTPGGIPDNVDFASPLWLSVTIEGFNGGQELSPRLRFMSAPSAMNAEYSESAGMADALAPGTAIDVAHFVISDTLGSQEAPSAGTMYRDNAPMAWGLIDNEGTIVSDYGIESVQRTGIGRYEIILDNAAVMVPVPKGRAVPSYAPIVQPSLLTDIGSPIMAQWFFRPGATDQDRRIAVQTFVFQTGGFQSVDAAFSIVVFGRPAN